MIANQHFRKLVVTGCIFLLAAFQVRTQPSFTPGIKAAAHATHIASITKDTIVVITGSTYRFTVDTPEDQGLVSTRPAVNISYTDA